MTLSRTGDNTLVSSNMSSSSRTGPSQLGKYASAVSRYAPSLASIDQPYEEYLFMMFFMFSSDKSSAVPFAFNMHDSSAASEANAQQFPVLNWLLTGGRYPSSSRLYLAGSSPISVELILYIV